MRKRPKATARTASAHSRALCTSRAGSSLARQSAKNSHRRSLPEWDAERALAALDIEQIAFTETDGNCQGYAKKRQIAINPVAQLPHKTLFHEAAHVVLGHTTRSRLHRHRTNAKESARSRSRSSRVALLRSFEPRRRRLLSRLYPELVMSRRLDTTATPSPKRARRRSSTPLIKSSKPDDYQPNTISKTANELRDSEKESNANNPSQMRIGSVVLRSDRARNHRPT